MESFNKFSFPKTKKNFLPSVTFASLFIFSILSNTTSCCVSVILERKESYIFYIHKKIFITLTKIDFYDKKFRVSNAYIKRKRIKAICESPLMAHERNEIDLILMSFITW